MQQASLTDVFRFYRPYMKRHAWTLVFGLMANVVAVALQELVQPILLKQFVDLLVGFDPIRAQLTSGQWQILVHQFLWLSGASMSFWFAYRIQNYTAILHQIRVMRDVDTESAGTVLHHSYEYFSNSFVGSLARKIRRLSNSYETLHDVLLYQLMPFLLAVIGISVILVWRFGWFGAAVVMWCMGMWAVAIWYAKKKMQNDEQTSALDSSQSGLLSDMLTNWLTIKLFTSSKQEREKFRQATHDLYRSEQRGWILNQTSDTVTYGMKIFGEAILIWVLLHLWLKQTVTVGDFFLLQGYARSIGGYFQQFGRMTRQITRALTDAKEGVAILIAPLDVQDKARPKKLTVRRGEIEFDRVGFSYQQANVIHDLNLKIRAKEKVAFVGPSGAGKTTLVKLLFRFYDVTTGAIRIDGVDIRQTSQDDLRSHISLVPQEPVLFHRSLRENIRYGKSDATDREVIEAAKKARCHEFISALPEGYDTTVGERGVKLSGGERQRVAIARAILKNAPILVLDEATSSLDSESEHAIQEALKQLMKGKTVIVIAHRLSTIMEMDRIVVLEGGRITDTGTHAELQKRKGMYRTLWTIQAGGFQG